MSKIILAFLILLFSVQAKAFLGKQGIHVSGLDKEESRQLSQHLQANDFLCQSRTQKKVVERKARKAVTDGLQALGYFNSQVTLSIKKRDKDNKNHQCWQLTLHINAGQPLSIRSVNIQIIGEANQQTLFQQLLAKQTLKTDERFYSSEYEKLKDKLAANGLRFGYFDAKFTEQRVDIYAEDNRADITLIWNSGKRYKLGDIQISQSQLTDALFLNLLSIKTGDPYDFIKIQRSQRRLAESNYFSLVSIEPRITERRLDRVPINITTTPGKKASYQVGIGFSTDTGPRLRGDYSRHHINQHGHNAEIGFLTSEVLTTVNAGYIIPWLNPKTDTLQSNITYIEEDNDAFFSERWEPSLSANRRLQSGWHQSASLTYSRERARVAEQTERTNHLVPALHHNVIRTDNPVHTKRGYSLSAGLLGAVEGVLSDSSFLQLRGTAKWIQPLPAKLRLVARTELGISWAESVDDIPVSRRFFAGGDNSVRGYAYRSLGPVEDGEVIGGKHLAVASIELQRHLIGNWSIASFFDTGNAWGTDGFDDQFDTVSGAGLGLRWRSPIGPLRLDIAFPLERTRDETSNDSFRLHLHLGPEL